MVLLLGLSSLVFYDYGILTYGICDWNLAANHNIMNMIKTNMM
jgi:hypothetical protein